MSGSESLQTSGPVLRSIPGRLDTYRRQGAPRAGLCASAVREALNAPRQGLPSAAAVWEYVPTSERRRYDAPRGSIVYWVGGRQSFGHVCFALGDHLELSVDVLPGQPGVADVVPFDWFGVHWPSLRYVGWSWFFGAIDTRPSSIARPLHG